MLKMKPTFIEENGKAKFVVFSMKDYAVIKEALEDAEDVRILEESKRRGAGKPRIPHSQILEEFGLAHLMRKAKKADAGGAGIPFKEVKRQLAESRTGARRKPSRAGAK